MPEFKLFKPKDKNKDGKEAGTNSNGKETKIKKPGLFTQKRGKMPTKTTINLAIKEEETVSLQRLLPGIIIAVLVTLVVGKFLVFDKIAAMISASDEVTKMQSELDDAYAQIASYEGIEDEYAHYTYSGMTEEELSLVDRVKVMELVEQVMRSGAKTNGWSITGNELTILVNGSSLQRLNQISRQLEKDPIVDRCTIITANKKDKTQIDMSGDVDVSFVVYLQKPAEEDKGTQPNQGNNNNNTGNEGNDGNGQTGQPGGQPDQPTGSLKQQERKEAVS